MATYTPPVSHLVTLGKTERTDWPDYSTFGIGPADVPELIRLVQDNELAFADSNLPDVYAQIHAWRALGQLRAEAAIEPLLDLLAAQEDDENWSDWTTEEVPEVLGMIGPAAIPPTVARLEQRDPQTWVPVYYTQVLNEIAKRHPETREEVIGHLCTVLEGAADNDPGVNGSVIGDLLDLKAVEAWPAIEAAFATGNVDEFVAGDAAHVKWDLGLGPQPPPRTRFGAGQTSRAGGSTPKARAEERARRKKAEKRKKKRRR